MSNQPIPNSLKTRFMMVAILRDEGRIADQIESIKRDFGEYLETVQEFIDLEPNAVLAKLKQTYPQIADVLSSPLAAKVVTRIQNHLRKDGIKQNAD